MKNTKSRAKKIVFIVLLSLLGLLVISGISAYFLIHNYINKMHLITTEAIIKEDLEPESKIVNEEEVISGEEKTMLFSNSAGNITQEYSEAILASGAISEVTGAGTGDETAEEVPDAVKEEISKLDQSVLVNLQKETEIMEDSKVTNILLIGSDTRISDERGRSDSMIVISINENTKKIIATSFLRDIYLNIPGEENNRLNTAYAYGGADLLLETLEINFKFKIDRYIMVDFFTFIDIVDAIGGITLEVKESELETINLYVKEINKIEGISLATDVLTEAGIYSLNGKQALGYSRNRYTSHGDFDRTGRQREVLYAIYEKAKAQNLFEMNNFLNVILPQITTNFSESEILAHMLMMPTYFEYDMEEWTVPFSGTYENINVSNMAVLGIDFEKNIDEIYHKLYNVD